jgi:predicted house-cleaning noncanonical NTP pyrophosphatase (MazG superfamily)
MRTFRLHKLLRDKIIEQNVAEGAEYDSKKLSDDKYLAALKAKLLEEANELPLDDHEEALKELADVQEVVDCLVVAHGFNEQQVQEVQATKNAKAGSFKERHFAETITLPADNRWVEYYASQPSRFPEVIKLEETDRNI